MKIDLTMQELLQSFNKEVTVDTSKEALSREDTLKYIKIMEEKKLLSLARLQTVVKQ